MFHSNSLRIARSWSLLIVGFWLLPASAFAEAPRARKAVPAADCVPVCVRCTSAETENEPETDAQSALDEDELGLAPLDECQAAMDCACCPPDPWLLCGGDGRWWGEAEYLLLWTNGNAVPALVTTNATVPPRTDTGVLGVGDTQTLLGDDRLDKGARSGVALTLGRWFDDCQNLGIQATWFYVGAPSDELNAGWQSAGVPVLARPFLNAATGLEDAQLVAYPDVVEGLTTAATSSNLRSVEALVRANWRREPCSRIDLLAGYRYLGFREGLRLEEHLTLRDPGGLAQIGTTIGLFDQFDVRNDFHGGTIGLLTSFDRGLLSLDVATKLGLGNVTRELTIDGGTHVRTPRGGQGTSLGGLSALPSNMGTYKDDTFALLPELDLQARLWLTDRLSFSVGYQLLFLTNVYRTGQQIDQAVSTGQLTPVLPVASVAAGGQAHPAPLLTSSTLCAQGLTLGLSFIY